MKKKHTGNGVTVKAYKGDAATLLAFSLDKNLLQNFTGFSIRIEFANKQGYYLFNKLTYKKRSVKIHLNKGDNIASSEFSPIQKFNWLHVPSTQHNVHSPYYGTYTYYITPRYIINKELQPLDTSLTASVSIDVSPFQKGNFRLGFTRSFIASQAYIDIFGYNNKVRPNDTDLIFDLQAQSGPSPKEKNKTIKPYSFESQFAWMGWQARMRVYEILNEVLQNQNMSLDVFAYDLNEPFVCDTLIKLAKENRVRIILDNASLHTTKDAKGNSTFEDKFEQMIDDDHQAALLVRGRFSRFSHSKILIQKLNQQPVKVLTGSTNFSTNGLYINSNHVLIFENKEVAQFYEDIFNDSFGIDKMKAFRKLDVAQTSKIFNSKRGLPDMTIRISPHPKQFAADEIDYMANVVKRAQSDVLFAVMNDTTGSGSLLQTIREAHERTDIFSYGIVDRSKDITLYKPNSKHGVRVAGHGLAKKLPPPFKQEENIPGVSIHHKFVVVDFKGDNPVVFCGSSNLAQLAETQNGDNLLEIRDRDIVTAFAIEAMRLIDHFHFRNRIIKKAIYLYTTDWYKNYYNADDLKCLERELLIKE